MAPIDVAPFLKHFRQSSGHIGRKVENSAPLDVSSSPLVAFVVIETSGRGAEMPEIAPPGRMFTATPVDAVQKSPGG